MAKFQVGQKVKVIKTGQVYTVIWVGVFSNALYRLDNGFLFDENELEVVESG